MAVQTIPRSAEMEFFVGTPSAFRKPVTHPVSTFYAQCPGMVMPYMDSGIHIGADNSIILEGDVVMNRTTLEIGEIDYFHGSHPLRFTLEGEMVERTVRMPVALVVSSLASFGQIAGLLDDELEDHWFAHDMILIRITSKVGGGGRYRYAGPFYKAVLTLQRMWRNKPPSGRLLTKW